jgi:tRNA-specific adenosine deaminase 2
MNATNRTYNGTRHAEFIAINEVLTTYQDISSTISDTTERELKYTPSILRESVLYVTVEPCIMCASLLRQFGIKKVFYGASNEKFGGTGGVLNVHVGNGKVPKDDEEYVKMADDYEVSGGWLREEAIVMLRRFYVQENERAPEPRTKGGRVLKLEVEPLIEGEKS